MSFVYAQPGGVDAPEDGGGTQAVKTGPIHTLVTMCAWGCSHQKGTRLAFDSVRKTEVSRVFSKKRCITRRQKKPLPPLCSFSGHPHQHLTGLSMGRAGFATKAAAEYPYGLCQSIVEILLG